MHPPSKLPDNFAFLGLTVLLIALTINGRFVANEAKVGLQPVPITEANDAYSWSNELCT
jgi:hypothetical protein